MLSKMRQDGVDIVSDSWGLCELFVPIKLTRERKHRARAAAPCTTRRSTSPRATTARRTAASANPNAKFLAIDDPSGQPFATAVGGTNLRTHTGPRIEKAWKGSGGGISINWPKPGYQAR